MVQTRRPFKRGKIALSFKVQELLNLGCLSHSRRELWFKKSTFSILSSYLVPPGSREALITLVLPTLETVMSSLRLLLTQRRQKVMWQHGGGRAERKHYGGSSNTKNRSTIWSSNPSPGRYPKELKLGIWSDIRTPRLTAALFTIGCGNHLRVYQQING